MFTLYKITLLHAWRQRYLQVFIGVILLAFLVSAINNVLVVKAKEQEFEEARQQVRKAWLNQGPSNPHSSAHYGHYVFRPVYAVHALDHGITPVAGSVLRLEAHAQHEPVFNPAQARSEASRLGEITYSWLLQYLLPLFIILLCFNAVSADREQQVLRIMAAQGMKSRDYLAARILAPFSIVVMLTLAGLLMQWAAMALVARDAFAGQDLAQSIVWNGIYGLYFLLLTTFSVLTSAWVGSSRQSLLLQVTGWALLFIVMPRLTANLGARLYPMEQRSAFNKALREDREKGIDGHNPKDERYRKFEDSLLRHYKVDSLHHLPINADGLIMQADEEYANLVYDKHFARIRELVEKQNSITRYAAVVNAFLALRRLSAAVAQTDFNHHMRFLRDAEDYRRYLIHNLNSTMAYGGSKTGDWDWTADPAYWATVKDFGYKRPGLSWSLSGYRWEIAVLLGWLVAAVLCFYRTASTLKMI
jgi:ABC-2 type transport system permease protein